MPHPNYFVIKIKFLQSERNVTTNKESNLNRLDQMTEQKYR